ncbi:hypothetical protein FDUTEX481_07753 [Tolypothrix sp. PCC 7601]|nr:hypothetical protein FDUTEX481_07753 [Tolypothrix sp. PCC 7601]
MFGVWGLSLINYFSPCFLIPLIPLILLIPPNPQSPIPNPQSPFPIPYDK